MPGQGVAIVKGAVWRDNHVKGELVAMLLLPFYLVESLSGGNALKDLGCPTSTREVGLSEAGELVYDASHTA